jgi:hypothetical protein
MTANDLSKACRLVGIVSTAQLLAAGKSHTQIATAVERGSLIRLGRGVFARSEVARQFLDRPDGEHLVKAIAALAVCGSGAVLSHQSAARIHGIDLVGWPPAGVTVTCPPERGWRGRPGITVHAINVPAGQLTSAWSIPITTPTRTVVDLARQLDFRSGVVAADSALHRKLTTRQELREVLAACARWRGIRRATEVVEFADSRAESPLESIARVVFRDCGLPPPDLQVWLGGVVEPVGRVDFYWKRYRTVAEVDGDLK